MIRFCARRGFLRTVTSFVGVVVAAVAASWLSAPLARFLYDAVVRDIIRAVVSRRIAEAAQAGLTAASDQLSAIPGWLTRMIPPGADAALTAGAGNITPAVEDMVEAAVSQPALTLLTGLCFFVLFTVFIFAVRYIARIFGLANRLPLIGPANAMLGGLLGAGQALVTLYLLAVAARVYIAFSGGGAKYLNADILGEGYLFSFFFRLAGQ